jgi:hypothetical protein
MVTAMMIQQSGLVPQTPFFSSLLFFVLVVDDADEE